MTFDVTYTDGRKVEVTSRPATSVAFENKFDRTIASLFADISVSEDATPEELLEATRAFLGTLRDDYVYFLAWHSSKSDKPYGEWLELVDEVGWKFTETADPTLPAASAGQ